MTRFQRILRRSGTILILLHLINMKPASLLPIAFLLGSLVIISDARTNAAERVVDFKSANGTTLKGTYFAAANPGPRCVVVSSKQPHAEIVGGCRAPACCRRDECLNGRC